MLDFANPYLLLLLLSIPVLGFLFWLSRRSMRRKLKRFGLSASIVSLMPDVSHYKPALKLTLRLLALVAIIFVLARPRYGEKEDIVSSEGSEIVIAFDLSRSMLAPSTDDPGSISRLNRARMLLEKLIGRLSNDKVGMVVFAGNARLQMPLTTDYRIVQMTMRNDLTPGMMGYQGTSISNAIEMSTLAFPSLRNRSNDTESNETDKPKNDGTHRAIILITDAEDHEGNAVTSATHAAEQNIQIDVIGVGSARGGRIPVGNGEYLRDNDGNEVVTAFNEAAAQEIAQVGNGVYVNAANPDALDKLEKSLEKLAKSQFESVTYKMSAEQFPLFAWIALALLILDLAIVERKTAWLKDINFFTNKTLKRVKPKK